MNRTLSMALIAGIVAGWGIHRIHARPAQGEAARPEVPFAHVTIDNHAPVNQWATGVGDINGDGYVDVVTSGSTVGKGGLYWYEYPGWSRHVIDATGGFSDDLQLVDVDKDGDLDIVVPEDGSKEVRWYESPGPGG
ncbi:MAG TPA: VCBS repeat-containing protein, partial [Terriglobia bacterium]|nr:VCBS repeat-containing protein [Terriglobia bacterium]